MTATDLKNDDSAEFGGNLQLEPVIDGKYELIRAIGEGGFSWVFLARHRRIPSLKVAIKVLKATHAFDGLTVRRFAREAEASAILKSRHSVKVMDIGTTSEGFPYLALELIRGAPLHRVLKVRPVLCEPLIIQFASDILLALREAHGFGLIHRDLKPANVFLSTDPNTGRMEARVIDFGIARFVRGLHESPDDDSPMTIDGSVTCTPAYAAPEVLRGDAVFQSDLYALGLVMAEMLEGELVYKDYSDFVAASKQLEQGPVPFGEAARRSPLFPVIERACAKNPADRFSSADQMRCALLNIPVERDTKSAEEDRHAIGEIVAKYAQRLEDNTVLVESLTLKSGLVEPSAEHGRTSAEAHGATIQRSSASEANHRSSGQRLHSENPSGSLAGAASGSWRHRPVWQYLVFNLLIFIACVAIAKYGLGLNVWANSEQNQIVIARSSPSEPAEEPSNEVLVRGSIISDTRWTADRQWVLSGTVFVANNAVLTIEPGTTVAGEQDGALVVLRGSSLVARGRSDQPIRFTSTTYRDDPTAGDWRGLLMLGDAAINAEGGERSFVIENREVPFGGKQPESSCGALEHVIFEYAGVASNASEEFNGLTLAGCGERTLFRNVVIAHSQDDGLEIHGGAVNLRNVAIWWPGDDGLDWDLGWTGKGQHIIVVMGTNGESAVEGDNNPDRPDASPRSFPTFKNVSLIGTGNRMAGQRALKLRSGSGIYMSHTLITGFPFDPIDIIGQETAALLDNDTSSFQQVFLTSSSTRHRTLFSGELAAANDDGSFIESDYFSARQLGYGLDGSPLMRERPPISAYESLRIDPHSPLSDASPSPLEEDFWRRGSTYVGAIKPGDDDSWYAYEELATRSN